MSTQGPMLVCFDLDETLIRGHSHNTFAGKKFARVSEDGTILKEIEPDGTAKYTQTTSSDQSISKRIPVPDLAEAKKITIERSPDSIASDLTEDDMNRFIESEDTGLRERKKIADLMIQAIDNGHKIAITSYTHFPEMAEQVLRKILESKFGEDKENINKYFNQICIVGGFPSVGRIRGPKEVGKNEHIEAARAFFDKQVTDERLKIQGVMLVDDSPSNIAALDKVKDKFQVVRGVQTKKVPPQYKPAPNFEVEELTKITDFVGQKVGEKIRVQERAPAQPSKPQPQAASQPSRQQPVPDPTRAILGQLKFDSDTAADWVMTQDGHVLSPPFPSREAAQSLIKAGSHHLEAKLIEEPSGIFRVRVSAEGVSKLIGWGYADSQGHILFTNPSVQDRMAGKPGVPVSPKFKDIAVKAEPIAPVAKPPVEQKASPQQPSKAPLSIEDKVLGQLNFETKGIVAGQWTYTRGKSQVCSPPLDLATANRLIAGCRRELGAIITPVSDAMPDKYMVRFPRENIEEKVRSPFALNGYKLFDPDHLKGKPVPPPRTDNPPISPPKVTPQAAPTPAPKPAQQTPTDPTLERALRQLKAETPYKEWTVVGTDQPGHGEQSFIYSPEMKRAQADALVAQSNPKMNIQIIPMGQDKCIVRIPTSEARIVAQAQGITTRNNEYKMFGPPFQNQREEKKIQEKGLTDFLTKWNANNNQMVEETYQAERNNIGIDLPFLAAIRGVAKDIGGAVTQKGKERQAQLALITDAFKNIDRYMPVSRRQPLTTREKAEILFDLLSKIEKEADKKTAFSSGMVKMCAEMKSELNHSFQGTLNNSSNSEKRSQQLDSFMVAIGRSNPTEQIHPPKAK